MSSHPANTATHMAEKALSDERKRKRDVLSCLDCRRRKLKCDRAFPVCGRCQRGGNAESCTYQSPAISDGLGIGGLVDRSADPGRGQEKRPRNSYQQPNEAAASSNGGSMNTTPSPHLIRGAQEDTIQNLEARLADLERTVKQGSLVRDMPGLSFESAGKNTETYLFRGKGFKTQWYGPTLPINQLAHFPEVRAFMKEVHSGSNLQRMQNELNVVDQRFKERRKLEELRDQTSDLLTLVPPRARVERLVELYFQNFESSYRILHKPTFWKDYETFWETPQETPHGFLPILLLVMALVRCAVPNETMRFGSQGLAASTEAFSWIKACDCWLEQQSQKHRFMAIYQVMCLRILAARANSFKVKRTYHDAEGLLTSFRAAGFHRDPMLLDEKRCSPFEKEMRRRLWITVAEIELQASVERGMPSTLSAISYDSRSPLNIDDHHIRPEMSQSPAPCASDRFTTTSFLRLSYATLPVRVALCSIVNNPTIHTSHEDVLRYEQQIREALESIPDWNDEGSMLCSTLLDLQLNQFLIMLHSPYVRKGASTQSRYSRMVCFDTAKRILDLNYKLVSSGLFVLGFLRQDVYRAATSICHTAFVCTSEKSDFFFCGVMSNFSSMLEMALEILEEQSMRRGQYLRDYWYVSAACSFVEMNLDPERTATCKLQSTERVARLYKRILDSVQMETILQVSPSLLPGTMSLARQADADDVFRSSSFPDQTGQFNHLALPTLDYFDTSEWMLDDLWPMDEGYSNFASNKHPSHRNI